MFNELVERAKWGDGKAKEEIIEKLQPLIKSSIRRYYYKPNEFEDLIQDGNLEVLESIESYNSDKGVYFLGYVKAKLRYLYLDKHKAKIHGSLNQVVGDGEMEIIDLLVSDEDILETIIENEYKQDLEDAMIILTKRQREILLLFYVERLSISHIAKKLDISYRTVVNTKTRALEKIKENIYKISIGKL